MVHCFHDLADTVGFSEDDLDHTRRSPAASSAFLSVVVRTQVPFLKGVGLLQELEEVAVPLEGAGKVVHDHTGVMCLQGGDEIERAILDLCR
jgi:hypothetical protein